MLVGDKAKVLNRDFGTSVVSHVVDWTKLPVTFTTVRLALARLVFCGGTLVEDPLDAFRCD